jgi:hypothetical protein
MSKTTKPADDIPADDDVEAPEWPKVLEWERMKFTVPNPEDWPIGALRAFEAGKQIDAMARVLGDGWSQIEDMPLSKTLPLFHLIAHTAGFADSGE